MLREFESVAKKIEADFESTQALSHPGVKGQARERVIVRDFLRQYLPRRYSAGSGLITDCTGQVSQQQDLVLYDGLNSHVLQDYEDNQLFFAEQVSATIEVKSRLDRAALRDVIDKARSVGMLVRRPRGVTQIAPGFGVSAVVSPVAAFGFGYTSTLTLQQIRDEAQSYTAQLDSPHWPSAVVVLHDRKGKSGLVVNVDAESISTILLYSKADSRFASVAAGTQGEALLHFYLLLMHRIEANGVTALSPDYAAYAKNAGLQSPQLSIGPDALHGTRFMLGSEPIEVDDMVRMRELLQKLGSKESMSDAELVELFGIAVRLPTIDHGFRHGTAFFVNRSHWSETTPYEVRQAIEYSQTGTPAPRGLDQSLEAFLRLIRCIRTSPDILEIIDTSTGAQCFAWRGSKEN